MNRVMRARLGYFTGVLMLAVGLFFAVGLGWALVSAGALVAAAFVWLYDVAEPVDQPAPRPFQRGDDW